jgi:glyoxylase-like metal-dependent hydrolase (beta-lactamase superfamily II)
MAEAGTTLAWERVTAHVMRCRLPFCDVTVGVVHDGGDALIVDSGTTLPEARAVAHDVGVLTGCTIGHVVLTHNHFDHVLGHSVFAGARVYCLPRVVATIADEPQVLRAEAVSYGADAVEVDLAVAALAPPHHAAGESIVHLGGTSVTIMHPGRGHTDHDLIAVVTGGDRTVVFCGDLVEESGDPCIDEHSDLAAWPATLDRVLDAGGESAAYVPGHGAVVDAAFVRRQAAWLAARS